MPTSFRLLIVPGVTVAKWERMWSERRPNLELQVVPVEAADAPRALLAGAGAGLVRLPVDRDVCDAIPLYTEVTVAVVGRDHLLSAADELTMADLAGEPLLHPLDDVLADPAPGETATTVDAIQMVAAGAGVLLVPQSIARLHQRRDITTRVVTDAPTSTVALAWVRERYDDLVEEMIGIVRGRTANSTRGSTPPKPKPPARRPDPRANTRRKR